eukprot:1141267-Pelagomonas_calceolata.AAC.2
MLLDRDQAGFATAVAAVAAAAEGQETGEAWTYFYSLRRAKLAISKQSQAIHKLLHATSAELSPGGRLTSALLAAPFWILGLGKPGLTYQELLGGGLLVSAT